MTPISAGFAQILSKSGATSGCGFYTRSGFVCTCAHVVAHSLGQPALKLAPELPKETVSLSFPFLATQSLKARVFAWSPDSDDGLDAALLEVIDPLPNGTNALPLTTDLPYVGGPFETHGFQTGTSLSVGAIGRIGTRNIRGWHELIGTSNHGYFIQPGFSGSPVWDVAQQSCVGMTKAVAIDANIRVAFAIPVTQLLPRLMGNNCDLQKSLEFTAPRYRQYVSAARRHQDDRDLIVRFLGELLADTDDPTSRYWIYETIGDIGGPAAGEIIKRAFNEEADPFARRGVEDAGRRY